MKHILYCLEVVFLFQWAPKMLQHVFKPLTKQVWTLDPNSEAFRQNRQKSGCQDQSKQGRRVSWTISLAIYAFLLLKFLLSIIFILFLFRNVDPVLVPILLAHSHWPNLWHDMWKVVTLKHENAGAFLHLHLTIAPFDIYRIFATEKLTGTFGLS